jgi:hypothetical protein
VSLEESEALVAGAQSMALEGAVDGAGSHVDPAQGELIRDPLGSPGGLRHSLGEDATLDLGVEGRRPPRPPAAVLGVERIGTVLAISLAKLVEEGPRDTGLPAGLADVAEFHGPSEQTEALKVYLLFEGHQSPSRVRVWQQERRRGDLMALFSLSSELSRPLRQSSL